MTRDSRPLGTQPMAPPPAPPRRPIVGAAMDDDDDRARQLQDLVAKIDATLQANRAAIARLAAWEERTTS
jgi:hypothetical protein